jgi:hypothetical protein
MRAGRYVPTNHFRQRLAERGIDMLDVENAILKATGIFSYDQATPQNGGSSWRIAGPDVDRVRTVAVGVEAFLDRKRRRMMLITVFEVQAHGS